MGFYGVCINNNCHWNWHNSVNVYSCLGRLHTCEIPLATGYVNPCLWRKAWIYIYWMVSISIANVDTHSIEAQICPFLKIFFWKDYWLWLNNNKETEDQNIASKNIPLLCYLHSKYEHYQIFMWKFINVQKCQMFFNTYYNSHSNTCKMYEYWLKLLHIEIICDN